MNSPRFLANENIPRNSILILRAKGFDVASVGEESPGITDLEVLKRAHREGRVILTFDRDYGELIFAGKAPLPAALIYLRIKPLTPTEPAEAILQLLVTYPERWCGHFCTIDRHVVRFRPLT
jgi:predicted nuclease of predicted toxin-antitoxin system